MFYVCPNQNCQSDLSDQLPLLNGGFNMDCKTKIPSQPREDDRKNLVLMDNYI